MPWPLLRGIDATAIRQSAKQEAATTEMDRLVGVVGGDARLNQLATALLRRIIAKQNGVTAEYLAKRFARDASGDEVRAALFVLQSAGSVATFQDAGETWYVGGPIAKRLGFL
jgi:hypothetical protein